MKFHFPVIVIDEDFRSENASGLGIRALAKAIETRASKSSGSRLTTTFLSSRNSNRARRLSSFRSTMRSSLPGPEIDQAVL